MAMKTCAYPNLAAEMARRGETQADIADLIGIGQPAVSSRLAGRSKWDTDEINALCDHYNRSYEYLFKSHDLTS